MVALRPFAVRAVMIAVPLPTAVTFPEDTVATLGLDVVQVMVVVALEGKVLALMVACLQCSVRYRLL